MRLLWSIVIWLTAFGDIAIGGTGSSFVFFGDQGTGEGGQYRVAAELGAYCKPPRACDFGLLLGDNFYPRGVQSLDDAQFQAKFEVPYKDIPFQFYAALGNHDHRGAIDAQIDYASPRWSMPFRYYTIKPSPELEIFVLDTIKEDGEQKAWFEQKIAASTAHWKIVVGHQPCFSGGFHGGAHHLKKWLVPLLQEYKVQFYLSGHDHDQQVIEKNGTVFVVSGAGSKTRKTKMTADSLFAKSTLGFAHLVIDDKRAVLKMISAEAVGGEVLFEKVYAAGGGSLPQPPSP